MKTIRKVLFKVLPRKKYLEIVYCQKYGRKVNLNNPKLFTEKLFWLKMYNGKYLSEKINRIHDKYEAREYVKEVIGEKYLSKIYGVFNRPEDIDFDALPDKFVLKLTKMNGRNIVCTDKSNLNINEVVEKFNIWLKEPNENMKYSEENYTFSGKPRIICEESLFIGDNTPLEYTIHCFNGKAKLIIVDDVITNSKGVIIDVIRNVYDLDWNLLDVDFGRKHSDKQDIRKPTNIIEMIEVAEKLAKGFPYVRVDLYNIDEKILFRELTFIPMGGIIKIEPLEYDEKFGELLELPKVDLF